jgi:prefoldin subunit 5
MSNQNKKQMKQEIDELVVQRRGYKARVARLSQQIEELRRKRREK